MNRRDLLKTVAIGAAIGATAQASSLVPNSTKSNDIKIDKSNKTRVIVCGGGFGGLTTAKYLKQFNPNLDVLLIEQNKQFISCPFSNEWLGEIDDTRYFDLCFDYFNAASSFGYEYINETILDINREKKYITTDNKSYAYDYLVLSPGIDYDYTNFTNDTKYAKKIYEKYPPAMKSGGEHLLLKRKIETFKGGNFIINVPSGIYRCPPAPYERACMIAYYFKKYNIKGKVILIDPREQPGAKPAGFLSSFNELYKNYIEYIPLTSVKSVNIEKKYITVDTFDKSQLDYVQKKIYFEDANLIPKMKPAKLISKANLKLNQKGWVELREPTFESVSDSSIFVVGDSNGYPYPKSGHMANSCGYIAAKYLAYKTLNKTFDLEHEMPSNICYSMVNGDPKEGISVHHTVSYSKNNGLKVSSKSTPIRDKDTGDIIHLWYKGIISDILGEV